MWVCLALGLASLGFGGLFLVAAGQTAFDFSGHLDQGWFLDEGAQTACAEFVRLATDPFHLQVHVFTCLGGDVGVAACLGREGTATACFAELRHNGDKFRYFVRGA